uniref:RBPJ-interacting and tubulin-associated protein n=1 Tax=Macrostomum lignano TaxID=282301 RepID=A0A1I8HJ94_9PLAT
NAPPRPSTSTANDFAPSSRRSTASWASSFAAGIRWMDRAAYSCRAPSRTHHRLHGGLAVRWVPDQRVHGPPGPGQGRSGWAIEGSPSAKIKWSFWEPFQSQPEHTLALANSEPHELVGSPTRPTFPPTSFASPKVDRSCDEPYFLPTLDATTPLARTRWPLHAKRTSPCSKR